MSHCLFIHDFFQDGRLDVLAEIRELQICGQWTKEKRAAWTKQAKVSYERAKHTYPRIPQGSSYYAGRIAGLKSAITADFPTLDQHSKMVFLSIGELNRALCLSCGDEPIWKCHPDGKPQLWIFLCDRCKQERERSQITAICTQGHKDSNVLVGLSLILVRTLCYVLLAITQSAFVFIVLVALTLGENLWLEDIREIPRDQQAERKRLCNPD